MVSLHGRTSLKPLFNRGLVCRKALHEASERPANPQTLLSTQELQSKVGQLLEWLENKSSVLTITGAGLSTESGIPDYRGHNGSYHRGHKPMIHDQFMSSSLQRKRYWGRGMVGWRDFAARQPNAGHYALATLESLDKIGVTFQDKPEYHDASEFQASNGRRRRVSLITQNVDSLHRRAGSKYVTELHGRTDILRCMQCGNQRDRNDFHVELEELNQEWLQEALDSRDATSARPDGDAELAIEDYSNIIVPPCTRCGGFFKPQVVFFGDSVPKHTVEECKAAVEAADGLLCVGSSLAVLSAFRLVRASHKRGVPIMVLNVGETRAETEGLDIVKLEAPAGPTLSACADHFVQQEMERVPHRAVPGFS